MKSSAIVWTSVPTDHLDATIGFFSDIIGLPLDMRSDDEECAIFKLDSGYLLEVVGPSHTMYTLSGHLAIGFQVDDIESARRELQAKGVEFVTDISTLGEEIWCDFRGPDGYLYELVQMDPTAAHTIAWAGLPTADFDATVRFFRDIFELPLTLHDHPDEFARFELASGQWFEIFGPHNPEYQLFNCPAIGFQVDDIHTTRDFMVQHRVNVLTDLMTSEEGTWFHVRGPEGYIYEIMQFNPMTKTR